MTLYIRAGACMYSIRLQSGRKRKVTGRKSDEVARGDIRLDEILPLPLLLWLFPEYGFDE